MNFLILEDPDGGTAVLTTDSPQSHYGAPVLRIESIEVSGDFGPGDIIDTSGDPEQIHADRLITAAAVVAAWAAQPGRSAEEIAAAKAFLSQWPQGPQI